MLLWEPTISAFEAASGWHVRPEGLCRHDMCVPLPPGRLDITAACTALRMPLVHDEPEGLWAVGPPWGGKALQTAAAPQLTLPAVDGEPFSLESLRGGKVLLLAWASW
jgi:hypothetical protein